jgi:pimeloyl-ACP methyl ester carboxylesterase
MIKSFASGQIFGDQVASAPPRVLALHGWRRSHADFTALLRGLDSIAVDLPGFGLSPEPPAVWGSREYAEALLPVLIEFTEPPVVLGHSFGGRIAIRLAAEHPDKVHALVLTGVPLMRDPTVPTRRPPPTYRVAKALHRWHLIGDAQLERQKQRHGSRDYREASGVMRDVLVRVVNETYEDDLRRIICPVEFVWADNDTEATLAVAKLGAELLRDVRLTVIPGAGHLTPATARSELRSALCRCLSGDAS